MVEKELKKFSKKKIRTSDVVIAIVIALITLIMLYPFVYVLSASLTDAYTFFTKGVFLLPKKMTFANYEAVFKLSNFWQSLVISVTRTVLGTIVSVLFIAMLAYGLCDKALPGRRWLTKFFFFTTIFSGGMIPYVSVLHSLNLMNTYWIYIVPAVYSFFNMIIIRTNFEGIPSSIAEAAKLDGASDVYIFFAMYMPLAKASVIVVAMYTAVFHWNDWFAGAFYVTNAKIKPLATVLQELVMKSGSGTAEDVIMDSVRIMAFTVLMILPITLVYPFLQKYFADGVTIGSIKE